MATTTTLQRNCTDCGQVDDHPRHTTVNLEGSEAYHHFDCGSRRNPACPQCTEALDGWTGGKTDELVKHLMREQ